MRLQTIVSREVAAKETAVGNHNPAFAPDLQPTLDRGTEAIVVAASAWLAR